MAQKEPIIVRPSAQTKTAIVNEPVRVFNFVFSFGKLRGSFLTYVPVFVVLYLKIVEIIDPTHESSFFFY